MRYTWDLMPPGAAPSRFVAIVVPATGDAKLWSIDDAPALHPAGDAYLADVRAAFPGDGAVERAIAGRLVHYAGLDEPSPNLVYLAIRALTELHGGRSLVLELGEGLRVTPLAAPDYAGALAEYDALGLDGAPAAPMP